MKTFGLIGFPLSHSFSKKYFTNKFEEEQIRDCIYELFPIESINLFPALLDRYPSLCGINVTIPYKVSILPFLDDIDDAAKEIGAVNCIDIKEENGKKILIGYNTDAFAFEESLKTLLKPHHKKALIFGDGGAAKAIKYVLKKLRIDFITATRNKQENSILYEEITDKMMAKYTILINTTPLGMSPSIETAPNINYNLIGSDHLAYDLVYNPLETKFLKLVETRGATTKNGLEMLYKQAEKAWTIWNK